MATFAPATDELKVMNAGLTGTAPATGGVAAARWPTAWRGLSIADTLVLSVFSVVYEVAVTLLRFRSRLLAGSPR